MPPQPMSVIVVLLLCAVPFASAINCATDRYPSAQPHVYCGFETAGQECIFPANGTTVPTTLFNATRVYGLVGNALQLNATGAVSFAAGNQIVLGEASVGWSLTAWVRDLRLINDSMLFPDASASGRTYGDFRLSTFPADRWVHLAITFERQTPTTYRVCFYVDGSAAYVCPTISVVSGVTANGTYQRYVQHLGGVPGLNLTFARFIDEVSLYKNYTLTADEVSVMATGITCVSNAPANNYMHYNYPNFNTTIFSLPPAGTFVETSYRINVRPCAIGTYNPGNQPMEDACTACDNGHTGVKTGGVSPGDACPIPSCITDRYPTPAPFIHCGFEAEGRECIDPASSDATYYALPMGATRVNGLVGKALMLNDTGAVSFAEGFQVDIANMTSVQGWALTAWIKGLSLINDSAPFVDENGDGLTYGDLQMPSLPSDRWMHIAISYEWEGSAPPSTRQRHIFVNGSLVSTSSRLTITSATNGTLLRYVQYIGGVPGLNLTFARYIDEVSLYKRHLSAAEVATMANGIHCIYNAPTTDDYMHYSYPNYNTTIFSRPPAGSYVDSSYRLNVRQCTPGTYNPGNQTMNDACTPCDNGNAGFKYGGISASDACPTIQYDRRCNELYSSDLVAYCPMNLSYACFGTEMFTNGSVGFVSGGLFGYALNLSSNGTVTFNPPITVGRSWTLSVFYRYFNDVANYTALITTHSTTVFGTAFRYPVIPITSPPSAYNDSYDSRLTRLDSWTHLAIITDDDEQTVYINGTKVGTQPYYAGNLPADGTSNILRLGILTNTYSVQFAEQLDELRIYNRSLTASEILRLSAHCINLGLSSLTATFDTLVEVNECNINIQTHLGTGIGGTVLYVISPASAVGEVIAGASVPSFYDGTFVVHAATSRSVASDRYATFTLKADAMVFVFWQETATSERMYVPSARIVNETAALYTPDMISLASPSSCSRLAVRVTTPLVLGGLVIMFAAGVGVLFLLRVRSSSNFATASIDYIPLQNLGAIPVAEADSAAAASAVARV